MADETNSKVGLINLPDMPESVDKVISNLTDIPSKNIGQTFGDLWYLVFGGISHKADKKRMKYAVDLEKFHQTLSEKIDSIPEEKKVEPSIQITAQALENSKYCISSEELRNMFVNLIAGTMHSDLEPMIHPSFPEMIKQMDKNDAHILMELKRGSCTAPVAKFQEEFNENHSYINHLTNAYISKLFKIPLSEASCSLSSLERMGLISISYEDFFADDSRYALFYQTTEYKNISKEIASFNRKSCISLKKGICNVTPLGNRFIGVCVQ